MKIDILRLIVWTVVLLAGAAVSFALLWIIQQTIITIWPVAQQYSDALASLVLLLFVAGMAYSILDE